MNYIKIKKDFLIGSSTNAAQTFGFDEGRVKNKTNWSHWYELNKEAFYEKRAIENDGLKNAISDIRLAKDINFNTIKTSIEWSRLMPDGETISQDIVDLYNRMIDEMIKLNIKPMLALNHFDLPLWAVEMGGWLNQEVIKKFIIYAEICFKLFADRVKTWFTFTEPIVTAICGYLLKFHWPLLVDFQKCYQVQHNLVVAHSYVVAKFRKLECCRDAEIGICLNLLTPIAKDNKPKNILAAKYADALLHNCFLEPCVNDYYTDFFLDIFAKNGINIIRTKAEEKVIRENNIDVLGFNYYNPTRVQAPSTKNQIRKTLNLDTFFEEYKWEKARMNESRGWEIYPKGLYITLINIKEKFGNIKSYITENGMGIHNEEQFIKNGMIIDDYRIEFLTEHMWWTFKAIDEGANCHGFLMWTYIDNWSWLNAYKNRYGYYQLDLKTKNRIKKKSAYWIKKVCAERKLYINKDYS